MPNKPPSILKQIGPGFLKIKPGEFQFMPKARNFIHALIVHPCARPWYLYVETLTPALLELFVTVTLLQLDDVVRDYAVVRSHDVADTGKRRKSHFRKLKGTPKGSLQNRAARQGLLTVLKITAPLEAIGFAYLLYSAGDRFFYNWQSLLEQSDFCDRPLCTGPLSRTDVGAVVLSNPSGQGFGYDTLEQNRANWSTSPLSASIPEGQITVTATIRVKRVFSDLNDVSIGLVGTVNGRAFVIQGKSATITTDVFTALIVSANFRALINNRLNVNWRIFGPSSATGMRTDGGDLFITNGDCD